MSDGQPTGGDRTHYEELAALHALGLLDEADERKLFEAARRDPEIEALLRDFTETAAALAHDAPVVPPPPGLRREIMAQLPAHAAKSNILSFPVLLPYALAACLMGLVIWLQAVQAPRIADLTHRLRAQQAEIARLAASDALQHMRLATLDAKDPAYGTARVLVAWDANRSRGLVSMENLPPAPAGHDYQLWALDPAAPAPVSAGVLRDPRAFNVAALSTPNPGFAVSLEPTGGSPEPTGPILFAVAPGA